MKFTVAHMFCGIGGKALGAAAAIATFGDVSATFETLGGIDVDPLACRDFEMLTGAPSLCADVHEIEPADLRRFFGRKAPDLIMLSPPCKGFSGLLSAKLAATPRYQRMNTLMERALFLIAATWKTPPKLVFVENVPRIASRGAATIRRCLAIAQSHGFATALGIHDCGELGGLAQHRRRWFMLWRHRAQLGQVVYEPPKHRVRACGEVLGPLPMPGDVAAAGPMHSIPRLSWRNWVRLALIPAGGDWRDLPGTLQLGDNPGRHWNKFAVADWREPAATVTGTDTRVGSGAPSVADPRWGGGRLGVTGWTDPSGTIAGESLPNNGRFSIADPRVDGNKPPWQHVAGVTPWTEPAPTITAGAKIHAGAFQVADPRLDCAPRAGAYRVLRWDEAAATITASLAIDNGAAAIADPRLDPDRPPPFTPLIIAADGTWHRPLTTLELAALQGFPVTSDGKPLLLAGNSHTGWRERIGNAVPPPAARAIGEQLLRALLIAKLGAFALGSTPVWVGPRAVVA